MASLEAQSLNYLPLHFKMYTELFDWLLLPVITSVFFLLGFLLSSQSPKVLPRIIPLTANVIFRVAHMFLRCQSLPLRMFPWGVAFSTDSFSHWPVARCLPGSLSLSDGRCSSVEPLCLCQRLACVCWACHYKFTSVACSVWVLKVSV